MSALREQRSRCPSPLTMYWKMVESKSQLVITESATSKIFEAIELFTRPTSLRSMSLTKRYFIPVLWITDSRSGLARITRWSMSLILTTFCNVVCEMSRHNITGYFNGSWSRQKAKDTSRPLSTTASGWYRTNQIRRSLISLSRQEQSGNLNRKRARHRYPWWQTLGAFWKNVRQIPMKFC